MVLDILFVCFLIALVIIFPGFFLYVMLWGMLFQTKLGRKLIYFFGYRSKATLGIFVDSKRSKYVKEQTNNYYSMMMNSLIETYAKGVKNINLVEFINDFYEFYRKRMLMRISNDDTYQRKYLQQLLISLRNVKYESLEKLNKPS